MDVLLAGPYNALYAAGFLLAFAIAAVQGHRSGWPLLPWLTLLAACVAGGVAGSKLLHFDLHVDGPGEKTILGGLAGGMLALLLVQRFLRFEAPSARVLAPAALLGFALGRVGCWLAGCCFGTPTSLPWGIRYAAGTAPFEAQQAAGLLDAAAAVSLPIHPTQLYEAALALVLAAALWRWGGRLRSAGAAALAVAAGYGAIRFGVEFYRAGGAESLALGLATVQWTVGAAAVAAALALGYRERAAGGAAAAHRRPPPPAEGSRAGLLLGALAGVGVLGGAWLTPLEQVVWLAALVPAAAAWVMQPGVRSLAPGGAMAALLMVPAAADTVPTPAGDRSYVTIGAGGTGGSYVESCGPARRYGVGGVSAAYTESLGPSTSYTVRGQVFAGADEARTTEGYSPDRQEIAGASLHAQYDWRYVGLGAGVAAGGLVLDGEAQSLLPSAMLRVGRLDGFFAEARLFNAEPTPVPAPGLLVGIGAAMDDRGSTLRAGVSASGFYGSMTVVTRGGTEIEPFAAYGDAETHQIGLMLRQRIALKRSDGPR
jgi:hypothetical protein